MSEAKALLDSGNLNEAIQEALNAVRSKPTDITARIFLFELSCFSGDWERAEKQLEVIGQQDVKAMIGAQIYKQNFKAEHDRISLFSEGLIPECLMPPPNYVEGLLAAVSHVKDGKLKEGIEVIGQVEEKRPAFACKVNGEESADFRDCNDLTMCVFEAIVKDSYTWLPFEQVESVEFIPAATLRDNYWRQAEVGMVNGTKGEMFLPSLYVDTFKSENDDIRLGRVTDWRDTGEDIFIGEGVRLYQLDSGFKPISEIESIEFIHDLEEDGE
ncbi:MAG: type VI secretion system accessory protein TagJ [Pyrinomonadaceae bacterium]